jgi:hypothetical protein
MHAWSIDRKNEVFICFLLEHDSAIHTNLLNLKKIL